MVEMLWHRFLRQSIRQLKIASNISVNVYCISLLTCLLLFFCIVSPTYASVDAWYIVDGNITGYRPVVNMGNSEVAKKINDDINEYYYKQKIYFNEIPNIGNVDFNYLVSYEDDKLLSLLVYTICSSPTMHGLVYDKSTGNRCSLNYFVRIDKESLYSLSITSTYTMTIDGWERNKNAVTMKEKHSNGLKELASNDFILLGEGSLAVICSAPIGYKCVDVLKLDQGQIMYLNWNNRKR